MNIPTVTKSVRVAAMVAAAFAAVLAVSWVAGQCREWRQPKEIPGKIDLGTPVAGPSSDAPTTTFAPPEGIAVPKLTLEQLREEARLAGLELAAPAKKPKKAASADPATADPTPSEIAPIFFTKERFSMSLGDAGEVSIDVSAWQLGPGERIDLRGSWAAYQPPMKATLPSMTCSGGGWLRNEAKWEGEIAAGGIVTPDGVGLGGLGKLTYRGPSTGRANWGATALAVGGKVEEEITGTAFVGAAVSIK